MAAERDLGRTGVTWVTGVNGFLARHVASVFASAGWLVSGTARRKAALPKVSVVVDHPELDTALACLIERTGPPAVIFHGIGSGTVGETIRDPESASTTTVGTFLQLLRFVQAHAPESVVLYPSSCSVYGQVERLPIEEDAPLHPLSPYGRLKLEVETLCAEAAAARGTRFGIIRYFSLYGPHLRKQLVWDLATRIIQGERTVELDGTGEERRDFLQVNDAARLAVAVAEKTLERDVGSPPLIVNGGSGISLPVREVAALAAQAISPDATIAFSGISRPGDPTMFEASMSRASELPFRVEVDPRKGLSDYSHWVAVELAARRDS